MKAFIVTAIASFVVYLALTFGSGNILFWSWPEWIMAIVLATIVGLASHKLVCKNDYPMLNPARWGLFIVYLIGPFFIGMAKANFDVAKRVVTGNINPGIVELRTGLKTDMAVTLLANSITLTPGTLTVDINEKSNTLYIHWLNVTNKTPKPKQVCGNFLNWARRIAE